MPRARKQSEHWYAMTTRPRKEGAACQMATDYGLTPYVPMNEKLVIVNRHTKRRELRSYPIVSGLVFVAFGGKVEAEDVHRLVRPGAKIQSPFIGIVGNGVDPVEIPHEQIMRMVRRNADQAALAMAPANGTARRFSTNDRVRVEDGPFMGITGLVVEPSGERAKVLLPLFGSDTLTEIHVAALSMAAE